MVSFENLFDQNDCKIKIIFQHTKAQWQTVFWISFVIFNVTNLIYVFFASGEEQWWNNPKKNTAANAEKGDNNIPMESRNE